MFFMHRAAFLRFSACRRARRPPSVCRLLKIYETGPPYLIRPTPPHPTQNDSNPPAPPHPTTLHLSRPTPPHPPHPTPPAPPHPTPHDSTPPAPLRPAPPHPTRLTLPQPPHPTPPHQPHGTARHATPRHPTRLHPTRHSQSSRPHPLLVVTASAQSDSNHQAHTTHVCRATLTTDAGSSPTFNTV